MDKEKTIDELLEHIKDFSVRAKDRIEKAKDFESKVLMAVLLTGELQELAKKMSTSASELIALVDDGELLN